MSEETALTIREETRPSLLSGSPRERVAQATEIAKALAPVIEQQKLFVQIQNKRHVLYEGWTTLGALIGVFPITAWSRPTEDGWEARVEARTLSGAIVGAAESECSRSESRWAKADGYAIRSMAQTRAGSKALRMPLGFIMQLGGFDATPAEEVEGAAHSATKPATRAEKPVTPAQSTSQRILQGYMKERGLTARKALGALGIEVKEDVREAWNQHLIMLQESHTVDLDGAYKILLSDLQEVDTSSQ